MIKFFRKIRQDLLSKGKTGKYFKYAIGEIVLVVIGILIALQINNLNEQKKLTKEYISDLNAIKENLEKDAIVISGNIKNGSRYAKEFLERINSNSFIVDESSIIMQLGRPTLYIDNSSYINAKNKNTLNLIQSDSLKNVFHEYYIRQIERVQSSADNLEKYGNMLKQNYLESGRYYEDLSKIEIMNSLMKQGPFIDYLDLYINERETTLKKLKVMKDVNTKLIETIDAELKQIE
jgi:hypothetical protein